jgi:hypothetical protein
MAVLVVIVGVQVASCTSGTQAEVPANLTNGTVDIESKQRSMLYRLFR